jgi:5'-3' exonuclease
MTKSRSTLRELFNKTTKQENYNEPTILVDTSYVVYLTAHSTWNWYKKEFDVENDYSFDPMSSKEYRAAFQKKFHNSILYTVKNVYSLARTPNLKKVIFALDAPKTKLWRNDIYPEYKLQRKLKDKTTQMFDYSNVFKQVKDFIIPNFLEQYSGSKAIEVPTVEGDDIIATIVRALPADEEKIIIASDHDFGQLLDVPNLKIANCQSVELTLESLSQDKPLVEAKYTLTPKEALLKKILMGDVADNIKGVFPRCGAATACKLILDKNALKEKINSSPEIRKQYDLNRSLVEFNKIPEEIKTLILETYNG